MGELQVCVRVLNIRIESYSIINSQFFVMQARWPERYDATSSHRFRHSQDMQFMFSYAYYLIHAKKEFDLDTMWVEELV